jgi:hypothetical protein
MPHLTLCRLTDDSILQPYQLMLVHSKFLRWLSRPVVPNVWTPGDFKTSGMIDAQRVKLELFTQRTFLLHLFSFLVKSVSVAILFFSNDNDPTVRSVIFIMTVFFVQGVPNAATLLLLNRHFFNRLESESTTTPMVIRVLEQEMSQNAEPQMGVSTLPQDEANSEVLRTLL